MPADPGFIVFYDGTCSLCHGVVRFLINQDRAGVLAFAPLQGKTVERLVPADVRATLPDSLVSWDANGQISVRSRAVFAALENIGGGWGGFARAASWIPQPLSDIIYDAVARVRYRIFGRESALCPTVPPADRSRILD